MYRSRRPLVSAAMVGLLMVVVSLPVVAGEAEVTRGSFEPFADGPSLGYGAVSGEVTMIRTAAGETIVVVTAGGLTAGLQYGSHVHNQACDAGNAGGHYSFGVAVSGGAFDGSEIWPGPFTANAAGHAQGWTRVGAVAGAEAVSVVIHAPGGAKVACADLS